MKDQTLTLLAIILCATLFLTACSMFQRDTQATASDGTPLFIDNNTGKATSEPVDVSGKPNEPLMRSESTGVAENLVKTGGSLIPPPFGAIVEAIGGVGLAGLAYYFKRKNTATDAAVAEYEKSIRANPEAAKAIDEKVWDGLSATTKAKLEPI